MERWQAERVATARTSIDAFIRKAEAQIEHLHGVIAEARKARGAITSLEDYDHDKSDRPGRQFG